VHGARLFALQVGMDFARRRAEPQNSQTPAADQNTDTKKPRISEAFSPNKRPDQEAFLRAVFAVDAAFGALGAAAVLLLRGRVTPCDPR
jgi:hypothetical protein